MEYSVRQTQRAVREGRIARARGVDRDANPYRSAPAPADTLRARVPRADGAVAFWRRLETAWWIGWDEAHGELTQPPSEAP
jgi:hypothetical protein